MPPNQVNFEPHLLFPGGCNAPFLRLLSDTCALTTEIDSHSPLMPIEPLPTRGNDKHNKFKQYIFPN